MRLQLLTLIATLTPYVLAGIEFTSPKGGETLEPDSINVEWKDDGDDPSIDDLLSYTITLVIGGNTVDNSLPLKGLVAGEKFGSSDEIKGVVDPASAESIKNGYYLKMESTGKTGGVIINYSKRFSLSGMTGNVAERYTKDIPDSASDVPDAEDTLADGANAAPTDGDYDVPYAMQSGLTKFAPMQKVPPTKITVKKFTPVHPTSSFKIASTWLDPATIKTTITASQTASVSSRENPAKPQTQPTDDMGKFLARWKD